MSSIAIESQKVVDHSSIPMNSRVRAYSNLIKLLVAREWRRVYMEPTRIFGMLLQPLVFLAVFGAGFHKSFSTGEGQTSYVAYFYPGILGLVVLFSSIYATLTLVEDKKCGFFKLVMVSPGGVGGAIIAKVVATASLGFLQSLLFLSLVFILPITLSIQAFFYCILMLLLGSLCFSLIGVLFAWLSPSPSAFHALMSVILIPMWLVSGAMFPLDNVVLAALAPLNPMAHLVFGLRMAIAGSDSLASHLVLVAMSMLFSLLLLVALKRRSY